MSERSLTGLISEIFAIRGTCMSPILSAILTRLSSGSDDVAKIACVWAGNRCNHIVRRKSSEHHHLQGFSFHEGER